ncbi:MAG: S8 family serine peptidase, partial [Thermoflexales bacterium]|nr:S8 family serine peptidase [Thermoflexales bacterium]
MDSKMRFPCQLLRLIAGGILIVLATLVLGSRPPAASRAFDSPLPTWAFTPPAPTATPVPRCHALAIAHLAREYDIPPEKLIAGTHISNENGRWASDGKVEWFEFPSIKQKVCYVKVIVKGSDALYGVALDEGGRVVDLEKLQALEREASRAICGKLDAALCARLPAMAKDEQVEVAIWLKDIDRGAIYDAVAARYPASLQPAKGQPFDADHPDYQRAFQEAEQLAVQAYGERTKPARAFLEAQGFKAHYASSRAPIVFVKLPKPAILALARREDTVGIYLLGGELRDALDSVVPTDRVSRFWSAGYKGNGIKVAILEDDPVDFSNPYLDQANGGTCDPFWWDSNDSLHPTWAAGVVAMDGHDLYRGIAPGVTLISADTGSYDPQSKVATAGECAINTYSVDVLNLSFGGDDPADDFWSRYFDHVVWADRRMVVAVAGNDGGQVHHPGRGYNVLTVGGFDDKNTPNWSDDEMWAGSSYQGPGNRDKPEVAAVSNVCTTNNSGGTQCGVVGTSVAAPQVSGLAALLMQRTGVTRKPELIKAIIMASAVHNIEGDSKLSDKDGVGGIDGALAYAVAEHGRYGVAPAGWYDYKTVYQSSFDAEGHLHYNVPASRGERIRVVLVYNSHPNAVDPYNNDLLYSDLDLRVHRPSGGEAANSVSVPNNFEIVEFIADETGTYDVQVYRSSWFAEYEDIGIAWVKEATYLPELRNKDGWASQFYVRNDGVVYRDVTINYLNASGQPTKAPDVCGLHPNQWCNIWVWQNGRIPDGSIGSAIIGGGEDVSVMVRSASTNGVTSYTGVPAAGSGAGWDQPGTTVYVPAALKQWGWVSTLYLQNTSVVTATADIRFYDINGNCQHTLENVSIVPNGQVAVNLAGITQLGSFSGSAVVSADRALAVVVRQDNANSAGYSEYNAFSSGADRLYLPSLLKGYY